MATMTRDKIGDPYPHTHAQKLKLPYMVQFKNPDSSTSTTWLATKLEALEHIATNANGRTIWFDRYTKSKPWGYFDSVKNVKESMANLADDLDADADGCDMQNGSRFREKAASLRARAANLRACLSWCSINPE